MPAKAPRGGKTAIARLVAIGTRLRARRKAMGVTATAAAEAAGMSRVTLHRIERGEPSVTIGAYMSAIVALGLDVEVVDPRAERARRRAQALPKRIPLEDYPQLKALAWQLGVDALTPKDALALYERNWRHVDRAAMSENERELVRRLVETVGGGRLLV